MVWPSWGIGYALLCELRNQRDAVCTNDGVHRCASTVPVAAKERFCQNHSLLRGELCRRIYFVLTVSRQFALPVHAAQMFQVAMLQNELGVPVGAFWLDVCTVQPTRSIVPSCIKCYWSLSKRPINQASCAEKLTAIPQHSLPFPDRLRHPQRYFSPSSAATASKAPPLITAIVPSEALKSLASPP